MTSSPPAAPNQGGEAVVGDNAMFAMSPSPPVSDEGSDAALAMVSIPSGVPDPWAAVIGQSEAVRRLAAAAENPVHAYLLVGPRGAGKRTAAAVFSGELILAADPRAASEPDRAARHRRLAASEQHPDVFVLSPAGNVLRREEEVSELIVEASRTPVEGARKILVVDRFHTANPVAAAALLKPVEEPADSVVWVLLAEQVLREHVTIASRCTRIEFGPVPDEALAQALVSEGLAAADKAPLVAAAAAGNVHRARVLASDERVEARRRAWWSIPDRLDGTGATVALMVSEVRALISEAGEALDERHRAEMVALAEREEQFGIRGSGRSAVEARHRREQRQFRTDELRFGLATLAARYRDQITANADTPPDERVLGAIDRIRATAESLPRSPNEALALQALLLDIPPL